SDLGHALPLLRLPHLGVQGRVSRHRGRRPPAGTQPGPRRPRLRPLRHWARSALRVETTVERRDHGGGHWVPGTPRRNHGGVPRPRWRLLGAGLSAPKPLWRAETTVHALCVRLSCDSYLTILAGREVCYVF